MRQNTFTAVADGKPVASIVLPTSASTADRRAAEIVQNSVRKMSGAELPISSGDNPAPESIAIGFPMVEHGKGPRLATDGFGIQCLGDRLVIASGGGKGAVYGAVALMEKLGCRVYSPGVSFFPSRQDIGLPEFVQIENPKNSFRCINGEFSKDPDYLDWQRLNTVDELYANGYYVHTFGKLVPPSQYFADHPEYFALVKGRRHSEQLCPSSPSVRKLIVQKLEAEMALQPGKKVWGVSQNDNETYCHCPDCERVIQEEGSPAGPIIRLVNQVAREFSGKTIATLAYQFSRKAPRLTKPDPNVMVMLCTIELNRSKPIAEDPTSKSFVRDIRAWAKICKNIYLWDYTVNFSHHISPFPNLHVLGPNLRFFFENGVRKQFQQTNTSPGHEFSELKSYLIAHLLWDPDANVEAVTDEFLRGYYGEGAPYIRKYIGRLQEACTRSGKRLDIYEPPTAHENDYLGPGQITDYNVLFDNAEASVDSEPDVLQRVKVARLPLQYAMLQIASNDVFGERGFYSEQNGNVLPRESMMRVLDEFRTTCAANGVTTVNESRLSPEQFCDATRHLTELQMDGNLAFQRPVSASPKPARKYGKGDLRLLTNGVQGGNEFRIQWLGWEGVDFDLQVDLAKAVVAQKASLDTIYVGASWILHPTRVTCSVSADGATFEPAGSLSVEGDQKTEELIKTFSFDLPTRPVRYVRFHFDTMKHLPAWHPAAGGKPWVFVDEIIVK